MLQLQSAACVSYRVMTPRMQVENVVYLRTLDRIVQKYIPLAFQVGVNQFEYTGPAVSCDNQCSQHLIPPAFIGTYTHVYLI